MGIDKDQTTFVFFIPLEFRLLFVSKAQYLFKHKFIGLGVDGEEKKLNLLLFMH
jgi:hypothetical protein